jgi:hypothetical protein
MISRSAFTIQCKSRHVQAELSVWRKIANSAGAECECVSAGGILGAHTVPVFRRWCGTDRCWGPRWPGAKIPRTLSYRIRCSSSAQVTVDSPWDSGTAGPSSGPPGAGARSCCPTISSARYDAPGCFSSGRAAPCHQLSLRSMSSDLTL